MLRRASSPRRSAELSGSDDPVVPDMRMPGEHDLLLPVSSADAIGSYLMVVSIVPVRLGPASVSVFFFFLFSVLDDTMELHIQLERVRVIVWVRNSRMIRHVTLSQEHTRCSPKERRAGRGSLLSHTCSLLQQPWGPRV